jgi:aminoglycoside phosphotransferase (APT) family kinase protein
VVPPPPHLRSSAPDCRPSDASSLTVRRPDPGSVALSTGLDEEATRFVPRPDRFLSTKMPSLVLRVPRNHPSAFACLRKESVAVPAARRAGVRTPALLFFDDTRELLPVPYAIFERVHGETLGLLDLEPRDSAAAYRELGCDLALLHSRVSRSDPAGQLGSDELPDPRHEADRLAVEGYFTSAEARWLTEWSDRLAAAALAPLPLRFLHGDTQASNMIVCSVSREYAAAPAATAAAGALVGRATREYAAGDRALLPRSARAALAGVDAAPMRRAGRGA